MKRSLFAGLVSLAVAGVAGAAARSSALVDACIAMRDVDARVWRNPRAATDCATDARARATTSAPPRRTCVANTGRPGGEGV